MFRSDNPIYDAERYNAYMEKKLNKRPLCSCCKNPIQEDEALRINDELICTNCETDDVSWVWWKVRDEYLVNVGD